MIFFDRPLFPTKDQAELLISHGLMPFAYVVLQDHEDTLIVLRYIDGIVKHLSKQI